MSAFPSLPLFTDAFIADTGHLTAQETGAYLMLMMVAWRTPECRLADDDDRLCRWARVDRRTWLRIKPTILEFWTLENGFWSQKRLSKERAVVSKRAEVARENGQQGGRPKSLENNEGDNPAGSSRATQKKAPNPISSSSLRSEESESVRKHEWPNDYREVAWKRYGKPADKKPSIIALENLYRADAVDFTELITSFDRQARNVPNPKYRPSLERFIKREKWTDGDLLDEDRNVPGSAENVAKFPARDRRPATVISSVASGLAIAAARRGIRLGGGADDGRSEDRRDHGAGRNDTEIADADWTPADSHHEARRRA